MQLFETLSRSGFSTCPPTIRFHHRAILGLFATMLFCGATPAVAMERETPRLVVQITVDALRGDLVERYAHMLGYGGFRYLQQGVVYRNAHYQHANTETIVGHASLATGTVPAGHGMVGNVWYDRGLDRLVYNIEDADYHLLSADSDVDQSTEIDPTQKAARVDGRSPRAILASTFSDELAAHYNGEAKIFGVSVKDRGAVSLAGQAGKAFWFSKASGEFVTSSYYYDAYPKWVVDWNAAKLPFVYAGTAWELTHERSRYRFADADEREYETDFPGFGRSFPHAWGDADDKYFTTRLTLSPAGDELTLDFAKTLVENEQLGSDDIPDFLAISFSSTDYVGHIFGASSLESEDNIARLDRTLADLFAFLDKKVGLENTLIVLSADHGQPEVPGYMRTLGNLSAHNFDLARIDESPAIADLKQRHGIEGKLIKDFFAPYLYLDRELIARKGLDLAEIESVVADAIERLPGVATAVSSSALRAGQVEDTRLVDKVVKNFHPQRSGDVYVVFKANVFVNDFDGLVVASVHGSPWRYDAFVPVMFAGAGLPSISTSRPVTPYDIAPTLASYLGVKAPSAAIGEPLREVLGN